MTKEKIRSNIKFNDKKEEDHASFYFKMKGIHFYKEVMIFLNHDFNSGYKLEWSLVSDTVKYDKKIRNRIYKYLATIEEYIRAYISNKYENDKYQDFWLNDNRNKLDKY